MLFRPAPKLKRWWDTKLAEQFAVKGLATILLAKRIAYVGHNEPANDRDHIRW